jgi:hypothetical protein
LLFETNRYHSEHIIFSKRTYPGAIDLDMPIPAFDPIPSQYIIRVVSDSWVGVEIMVPVSLRDINMPEQITPYTDLLDLTPLPITALQDPRYEQLYSKMDTFNPVQTQLFHVLYHTDTPVLLGAPTGSGKVSIKSIPKSKQIFRAHWNSYTHRCFSCASFIRF